MFRTAELGQKISKRAYQEREPVLRQALLEAQQRLRENGSIPVLILFSGVDGAGKGQTVNLLNAWMDPRWLVTRAYDRASDEERERPQYWRFWRDLPPSGRVGLFLSAWYSRPLLRRVYGKIEQGEFDDQLRRIANFERALTDDGAIILKFWMHLSRKAQKKRLTTLEKDPLQSWRVTRQDWDHWKRYESFIAAAERSIMFTSTGPAPWQIIEGADPHYRSLRVGELILEALHRRLDHTDSAPQHESESAPSPDFPTPLTPNPSVLRSLDTSLTLPKDTYRSRLAECQGQLNRLQRKAHTRGISTILLFEGPDAAGKGGAIRRVTAALDARHYQVIPIAAPTEEERAHHYLWRFWRHLSRAGRVTLFDRSWYGRVLVERVEGFAREAEWRRAYAEINDFEEQLIEKRIVLVKFWIHISKEEQLARFQAREQTPYKRWKLTDEDWRNREKWEDYEEAVNDMVQHTSTRPSPWVLVEGNDKRYARIKVLEAVCEALKRRLKG